MKRNEKHQHEYKVAGVSVRTGEGGGIITNVLFKCDVAFGPDCYTSKTLAGSWTLHDLSDVRFQS